MNKKIDVLYCVEKRDVNQLFIESLKLCVRNFKLLNDLYIVTNDEKRVTQILEELQLPVKYHVLRDEMVLGSVNVPGWFLQQMIKLKVDEICETEYISIIGADALLMQPITETDLFEQGEHILYYNRYPFTLNHLEYERKRVHNVAEILQQKPYRSCLLGDFIMELMTFKTSYLKQLRRYLSEIYGDDPIYRIIKSLSSQTLADKTCFGEWTLYAVFLLDVLKLTIRVKNSNSSFVEQIHSSNDLYLHSHCAKVIHCVDKNISREMLMHALEEGVC